MLDFIGFSFTTFKESFKVWELLETMSSRDEQNIDLHGDLRLGSAVARSTHANGLTSKFYTAEHHICDGAVKLIRTKQSGEVWQMRCWVHAEKKYLKKSLRTKDLDTAKEKARQIYYATMGKIDAGQRIFTITMGDLVEKYIEYQQDRVDGGFITAGRLVTIKTQLKHLIAFVGEDRKLDTITRERYKDYYHFRRKNHPKVRDVTLVNERATIGHLYKFAHERAFINQDRLPVWSEIKRINVDSRTSFNPDDYRTLHSYLTQYTKKITDERELYYRQLVRDFILILSNTGLRFGEARFLKWHCVDIRKGNNKYEDVQIRVEAETSKVRRTRTAIGMRGDIFKRIKKYSKYTHQMDYVFADFDTGEPVKRKLLYKMWKMIMKDSPNDYSYYCLRHTFATYRLQFGRIDIRTLAKIMGCSVRYIEQHYDSAKVENMMDYITRDFNRKDALDEFVLMSDH